MSSLKELLKSRILTDVVNSVQPRPGGPRWKVLVVDVESKRIIDSACKTQDILNCNVTDIAMIENPKRQPFPDMEAIYFLSPTPESVEALITDYARGKPPYAAVHLYFTSATENHCFNLGLPFAFSSAMSAQSQSLLNYELEPVARRLVSVLATLGEYPYIRYYHPSQPTSRPPLQQSASATPLAGKIAQMVQHELDDLCRGDPNFPPESPYSQAVLMIVDRGIDPVAPLIHEFTYQAMANDLMKVDEIK
ncbi:vacuolar sorting protein VPS33/slp1 [Cladochytrium tenue]|nr:vacuolar sorting protein VPS33/slp1 [Cladochytrium tenue]